MELIWSTKPIRRNTTTGAANLDLTGLYDMPDLKLSMSGLAHNTVGADTDVLIQLTFDGVSWDTDPANYVHINYPGGAGFLLSAGLPEAVNHLGVVIFTGWNEDRPTWLRWRGGRSAALAGARFIDAFHKNPKRPVGMRITNSLGYPWTTNTGVLLRQRQAS